MANLQQLLESPFRWIARWDNKVTTYLNRSGKANRARRERDLRRNYLNG